MYKQTRPSVIGYGGLVYCPALTWHHFKPLTPAPQTTAQTPEGSTRLEIEMRWILSVWFGKICAHMYLHSDELICSQCDVS